jgi:hypothetical protein
MSRGKRVIRIRGSGYRGYSHGSTRHLPTGDLDSWRSLHQPPLPRHCTPHLLAAFTTTPNASPTHHLYHLYLAAEHVTRPPPLPQLCTRHLHTAFTTTPNASPTHHFYHAAERVTHPPSVAEVRFRTPMNPVQTPNWTGSSVLVQHLAEPEPRVRFAVQTCPRTLNHP